MAVYGNVNVKYAPCKSVAQLHSAADYILGKKKEQLSSSVIKTKSELYNAFGCNRDNFANSVLMTRKMHQKKYSRFFPRDILAQKLSISFHPEDNDKLTYAEAYKMAEDFAREFFWKKGFEVLFAVHVDTEHVHVHFLVNNCNQKDGSSFRRGPKELVEMSEYFGEQCRSRGLTHSVRDSFYNPDKTREERTLAENHMQKRGKLSFKDEMRVYIRLAMNDPTTQNIHDVVNMLERTYHMNVRLKGNTISYALPYRSSNGGKVKAVRGSKLGKRFTVAGIREYMKQKEKEDWFDYPRQEQDIEHSSQSMKDYPRWEEDEEEVKNEVKRMNKKQKKIFFCVCMIFFLFLIVTIYLLKQKSPYEYLKEQKGMTAQTTANECLEEIRFDNKYIVFFINENGNLSCAVMKKKIFSYEILRISGELSQSKNSKNYLFSSYEDNGYKWIDWGVINDSDIESVLSNDNKMNIIDNLQYSFRICWIIGNGEENTPPEHEEIKIGSSI